MNATPDPTQTPAPDNATAQWFDSIGKAPTPSSQPPHSTSRKRFILVACSVLILAAGSGVATFFLTKSPACLSVADYARLTGTATTAESLSPTEGFYADYVAFQADSNKYDNSGEHGESLIRKIADFYSSLDKKTSILITIKGNYFDTSASSRTQERLNTVRSSLVALGIPETILKMTTPVYVEPEEAGTETSEILISITSASSCQ